MTTFPIAVSARVPGQAALTRTARTATSTAISGVEPTTANFDAQ